MILPGVIAGKEPEVAAAAPTSRSPQMAEDMARDLATWQGIQNSTRTTDFEAYIAAFPNGHVRRTGWRAHQGPWRR